MRATIWPERAKPLKATIKYKCLTKGKEKHSL